MKPIILFDLDGTLIDSTEAIVEGFFYAFDKHKKGRPTPQEITLHVGHTLEDIFRALHVEEESIASFISSYKEKYRMIATQKTTLLPYALEALQMAKSFATLGVVTTKTGRYSKELLEHFGVLSHFEVVIGREDVVNPKPHYEPIMKALESIKSVTILPPKEKIWMVGDTILDLQAAQGANISSVGVKCGYGKMEDLMKYSEIIADNSFEAVKIIDKFVTDLA